MTTSLSRHFAGAFSSPGGAGLPVLRTWAVTAALLSIILLTFVPLCANDFWLQAKIGQLIWEEHRVPPTVLFPFTEVRNLPFNSHEWLPSVAFYLLLSSFGYERLLFVQGAFGLLLFGLSWALAYRWCRRPGVSLLLAGMAMLVANSRHYLRPELFSLVLLLTVLHLLSSYEISRRKRWLVACVPVAAIWANSHGSFPLAPVVAALYCAGTALAPFLRHPWRAARALWPAAWREALPYGAASLGMLAASLVNPLGYQMLVFSVSFPQSDIAKLYIKEWTPTFSPDFMATPAFWVYAACLAITLAVVIVRRRQVKAVDMLLLLAFGGLSATRCRFPVLFGFIAMFVLARLVPGAARTGRREWGATALAFSVVAALVLRFGNLYQAYPYRADSQDFSPALMKYLDDPTRRGNVFNSYELGAELIYHYYPRLKPSLDSRIDSYGAPYFLAMLRLLHDEPALMSFVNQYRVDHMLLMWRDFQHIKQMNSLRRTGWHVGFADNKVIVLERDKPLGEAAP